MDKREKYGAALLIVLVIGTAWLKWKGHPSLATSSDSGASDSSNPFLAPYSWSTPGIADNPVTLNGGTPFSSVVNVSVNPSYLGSLSQQYIPMFGFVGMGYDPGQQTAVSSPAPAPTALVAPPPPAYVPPPPPSPAFTPAAAPFSQPLPIAAAQVAAPAPAAYWQVAPGGDTEAYANGQFYER